MQTQNRIMIIQGFLFRNCRRGIIMYKFYLKFVYTCIYLYYVECVWLGTDIILLYVLKNVYIFLLVSM